MFPSILFASRQIFRICINFNWNWNKSQLKKLLVRVSYSGMSTGNFAHSVWTTNTNSALHSRSPMWRHSFVRSFTIALSKIQICIFFKVLLCLRTFKSIKSIFFSTHPIRYRYVMFFYDSVEGCRLFNINIPSREICICNYIFEAKLKHSEKIAFSKRVASSKI